MGGARFEHQGVLVRRSRRRLSRLLARVTLTLTIGPVALCTLAAMLRALGVADLTSAAMDLWLLSWFGGVPAFVFLAAVAGARTEERATAVAADDGALTLIDGAHRRVIPRSAIDGALMVVGSASHVEITLAAGDVLHVELGDVFARRALVTALGFTRAERRTVIPLGGARGALGAGCWGVVLGVLATILASCGVALTATTFHVVDRISAYLIGFVFVAVSAFFARRLTPGRLVVGADGVLWERTFHKRFFPLASIRDVKMTSQGPAISIEEAGQTEEIVLTWDSDERGIAMTALLAEALAAARLGCEPEGSALVARGGRPLRAWRESLRKLTAGAGGYRGEAASLDALLRTAGSAAAPAEQRLGAAMAIALAEDDGAKQKLRVVVEGIASEKLRIAMVDAARGGEDEAAIEEALEEERRPVRRA